MDKLISAMKIVLGTAFSLYLRLHAAHWNVEGPLFAEMHALFEMMYEENWKAIDAIAEQIRQLDAYAPASFERMIELSRIQTTNEVFPPHEMLVSLLRDTETMIATLTEAFHVAEQADKQGLANFLAGRLEAHSKFRWQLRASAKKIS